MPDEDGHVLLRALQKEAADACPPVVAVTAYGTPRIRQELLASGFAACLVKPLARRLTRAIADLLAR